MNSVSNIGEALLTFERPFMENTQQGRERFHLFAKKSDIPKDA